MRGVHGMCRCQWIGADGKLELLFSMLLAECDQSPMSMDMKTQTNRGNRIQTYEMRFSETIEQNAFFFVFYDDSFD